jgi:hypothetical protein
VAQGTLLKGDEREICGSVWLMCMVAIFPRSTLLMSEMVIWLEFLGFDSLTYHAESLDNVCSHDFLTIFLLT